MPDDSKGWWKQGSTVRFTPTYSSWVNARKRCFNRKARSYDLYGGRGITMAPEWARYAAFYADMGPRPAGTSLDRIDPDGHYAPGNCRWADPKTQRANQRRKTA